MTLGTSSAATASMTEDELIAAALEFQSSGGPAYAAALKKLLPRNNEAADMDADPQRLLSQIDQSPTPARRDLADFSEANHATSRTSAEAKLIEDALAFQSSGSNYDEALQKLTLVGQQGSTNPLKSTLQRVLKEHDIGIAGEAAGGSTSSAEQALGGPVRPQDESSGRSTLEQVGEAHRATLRERRRRLAKARSKGGDL